MDPANPELAQPARAIIEDEKREDGADAEKRLSRSSSDVQSSENDAVVSEKGHHGTTGPSPEDMAELKKLDSRVVRVKDGDAVDPFAHLPEHEKKILKRQLDTPSVKVTYATLFRYATRNDIIILVISSICAIAGGAVMPLMTVRRVFSLFAAS